mmetsp:Transcript_12602/g.22851  ORF Transcript_12602/g.22851 Transcript_12602/m.22851 type:complete len:224 (+) Transcript_12602:379-1050(+)
MAVDLNTNTSTRECATDCFVLRHGLSEPFLRQMLNVPTLTKSLWDWRTERATTLVNNLHLRAVDQVNIIHDRVPERQLHHRDEVVHTVHLLLADPSLEVRKVCTISHAGCDSVAVQHACWKLVARRPCVSECMWSALMRLPQVTILAAHVSLHGLPDDEVALAGELWIRFVAHDAELIGDKFDAHILEQAEQTVVLHARHLNDLCNTVAQPSRVERAEELAIR